MEANPGKCRRQATGGCAREFATMEISWMTPIELLLLLIAAMPALMLLVLAAWREKVWERKRWQRRIGH
jgi:hypothetical protein